METEKNNEVDLENDDEYYEMEEDFNKFERQQENMMDYLYANGNLDAYYEDRDAGYIL